MPSAKTREVVGLSSPSRVITNYFVEVGKCKMPTAAEELELFKQYETAKEEIIAAEESLKTELDTNLQTLIANRKFVAAKLEREIPCGYLRFVILEARKRTHDETLLKELISAGNIGLMTAVKKFRYRMGNRFLTYAAWWIRVFMQEQIQKSTTPVHIPNHIRKEMQRTKVAEEKLIAKGTLDKHSAELPTASHIDFAVIPDTRIDTETTVSKQQINILGLFVEAKLTRFQRLILYLTFGVSGIEDQPLEDIAKYLYSLDGSSISTDRIRFIRCNAIDILRDYLTSEGINIELNEIFA